jgi:hypothetical protein
MHACGEGYNQSSLNNFTTTAEPKLNMGKIMRRRTKIVKYVFCSLAQTRIIKAGSAITIALIISKNVRKVCETNLMSNFVFFLNFVREFFRTDYR